MHKPDESLLHAYADDQLAAPEREEVALWLATHPDDAARVECWRACAASLKAAYDPVLAEPVPETLLAAARGRPAANATRWGMAAAVGWLAIGLFAGYVVGRGTPEPLPLTATAPIVRDAAVAHAVYAPEVRHPVEVGADERAHLVGWLSKRLGHKVDAPALDAIGYQLIGGRLLAADDGPGAQFMYEAPSGERLTLFVGRSAEADATAFRFAEHGGVRVFYWVDGGHGYALSGTLPREALLDAATLAYRALNP